MISTGIPRDDKRIAAYLITAMVPKYTATILFLRVNAYTLRWNRISQLRDEDGNGVPQRDEGVRREQQKPEQDHISIMVPDSAPG